MYIFICIYVYVYMQQPVRDPTAAAGHDAAAHGECLNHCPLLMANIDRDTSHTDD